MIEETLRADHDVLQGFFQTIFDTKEKLVVQKTFEHLRHLLSVHIQTEEETLYSRLISSDAISTFVRNGQEKHRLMHLLLTELNSINADAGSAEWFAKFHTLYGLTRHHFQEEEKIISTLSGHLFPEENEQINREFKDRKQVLMELMRSEGSIKSELVAVPPHHVMDANVSG